MPNSDHFRPFSAVKKDKQAGAELCQAQVKLGWQSNWVIGSLSFVFNYGYDLQKVATHLFIHG